MSARAGYLDWGLLGLGLLALIAPGPLKTVAILGLLGVG